MYSIPNALHALGIKILFLASLLAPAEELSETLTVVVHFEKKYGGEYKGTLASKSNLTPEEERDAHEWAHILRAVEERRI